MVVTPKLNAIEFHALIKDIDLNKLSEPELKRLAEIKWFNKRSIADGNIYGYLPLDSQERFHRSLKKLRFVFGGNRSGKTKSGISEDTWYSLGIHPWKQIRVPNNGWICSMDYGTSREVAEQAFFQSFPKSQVKSWNKTERTLTTKQGSTVAFKSYDSGAEKFQGRSMDWIHLDEEPPKQIYQECLFRLMDTQGHLWCTMTPTSGITWVYDDIYDTPDVDTEYFFFKTKENNHLNQDEVLKLERMISDEEKEMRLEGKFIQLSGLVYKEFKLENHVIQPFEIPKDWSRFRSIDHGLNNPTCCLWGAVNKEGELYIYDEYYETDKTVPENAETIKGISSGDKYVWSVIDPSTQNRDPLTKTSIFDEYRKHGVYLKANRSDKISGINLVKQYLRINEKTGRPKLFIFNNCPALIKEIQRYRWKSYRVGEDKNLSEEPQKVFDHAMDALRYLIVSKPYYYDEQMEDYSPEENTNWYQWR